MFAKLRCPILKPGPWRLVPQTILLLWALAIAEPGLASQSGLSPLAPPDTSSPRATLKSFRESMEAAYREFYESPNVSVPVDTPAQVRGIRCLDISKLPPAEATRLGAEAAILLNEILDRVELPPYEEIPDLETLRSIAGDGPFVYRVPNTGIAIVQIEAGPRKGEFLISAETVGRLRDLYERSVSMAPQPGAMNGLYKLFSVAPGDLISRSWIEQLPNWAKKSVLDQAVWKWFAVTVIIGCWCLALVFAYRFSRSRDGDRQYWWRFSFALVAVSLTYFVHYLLEWQIILIGVVFEVTDFSLIAAYYVFGAVALLNLGTGIANTIITARRIDPKKIDAHLISVTCRAIAWALVIVLLSVGASTLGIPIEAVIASLGVGGLAGALAARPTLENLIAGVTLYLDRPVRVGDFCQFGDVIGSVEEIGLRSTRIRQWGGSLLSVPNSHFADQQLENFNDMNYILFRGHFGLRLDTSPDQLRFVLAKLREIFFAHPKVNWPRVRLVSFSDHSFKIQLLAYVDTVNWAEYYAIREDLYIRTLEVIEESGARLAVPIQMTYLSRDGGKDETLSTSAEEQVKAWRESGELPFPDMSETQREELHHTLDYPPKGSVDFEPSDTPDQQREKS